MSDNYLRLGATLCMAAVALCFLADALTLKAAWRRRRRPRGLTYNHRRGVVLGLVLVGVTLLLALVSAGVVASWP